MNYTTILREIRESVKSVFGESFEQQLLDNAILSSYIEDENIDGSTNKYILLNYLNNISIVLRTLDLDFFQEEILDKLNQLLDNGDQPVTDIFILLSNNVNERNNVDESEMTISLYKELKSLYKRIKQSQEIINLIINELYHLSNNNPNQEYNGNDNDNDNGLAP